MSQVSLERRENLFSFIALHSESGGFFEARVRMAQTDTVRARGKADSLQYQNHSPGDAGIAFPDSESSKCYNCKNCLAAG